MRPITQTKGTIMSDDNPIENAAKKTTKKLNFNKKQFARDITFVAIGAGVVTAAIVITKKAPVVDVAASVETITA